MIEISGFRIRNEIEKLFLSPNSVGAVEALKAFSAFLPSMPSLDTYRVFQQHSRGSSAFMWASLFDQEEDLRSIGLSNEDLELALDCFHQHLDIFKQSKKHYELVALFQMAQSLADREYKLLKLAPYNSPEEKIKALGFGGDYFVSKGLKGKEIGQILESLRCLMYHMPQSGVETVQAWVDQMLESGVNC